MEMYLLTAGEKIKCLRCTAHSCRSGLQCGRPALNISKTQKCQFHGGRGNSAPKTEAGRRRSALAHTKSGNYTKVAKLEQSKNSARLERLEDALHVLGMTLATKTRGRKSTHYVALKCIDDVQQMIVTDSLS